MNNFIKKIGGPKTVTLIAIVLTVIVLFGMTIASSTGNESSYSDYSADHGHSHD